MLYRNAKMFWKNIKNTILEKKSLKGPFAIYLDLECLLKMNQILEIIITMIIISKNLTQKKS